MDRPVIICHMMTSLDGKVTGSFLNTLEAKKGSERYYELHRAYGAQAFACGRVTMEGSFMDDSYPDLAPFLETEVPEGDYIADKSCAQYAVAFDRKGRLGWKSGYIQDEDNAYNGAHIIEVVSSAAQSPCLAYFRSIGVSYLFAETLQEALEKLKALFGIEKMLLEGGSELNGAFLKANLVDEISLIQLPVLTDPKGKPLFERTEFLRAELTSSQALPGGMLETHYLVVREPV